MAIFLIASALLCLLVLATLVRPLWRPARGVALGLAVVLAGSTALLYALVGNPRALQPQARQAPQTLAEAIDQLEATLKRDPAQAEGWALLAQAYQTRGDAPAARDAFARAAKLDPRNPDLLTAAAQSRAAADPARRFDGASVALLQAALQADPAHQRARWFLGVAQRQAGRNAEAAATWEPLLARVDAGTAPALRKEIDAARRDAGLPPLQQVAAASPLLTVQVTLDQSLAARVREQPDATVFVIARKPGGAPMPVAARKQPASMLPLTFALSDADSPMPTLKLSQVQEIELVARLSASGDAGRRDGDVESAPVRVTLPPRGPVTLRIGGR